MKAIKRVISVVTLAAMALMMGVLIATNTDVSAASALPERGTLKAVLTVKGGPESVSFDSEPEGSPPKGPESLVVDERDDIWILDSLGGKVLRFTGGSVRQRVDLRELALNPLDLLVTEGHIFVLDADGRVLKLDRQGALVERTRLPHGVRSIDVKRLAMGGPGGVNLWASGYVELPLQQLPERIDPGIFEKKKSRGAGISGPTGGSWYIKAVDHTRAELCRSDGSVVVPLEAREGAFGSASIVGFDASGRVYVLMEELVDPAPVIEVELTLWRFSPEGKAEGVALLPAQEFVSFPHKPVEITASGDAYLLVPGSERATVYAVNFGKGYDSTIPRLRKELAAADEPAAWAVNDIKPQGAVFGGFKGYPISQTRSGTRSRALQMVNYTWTWQTKYDYLSNGTHRNSVGADKPAQLRNLQPGNATTGIPYSWGCWDSPWTYSDNWQWTSFANSLTKYTTYGPLVGKTNSSGGWISGTSGIDCSGFVAAASDTYYIGSIGGNNYYKPGTGKLQSDGKVVSNVVTPPSSPTTPHYGYYSGMQPMDFFVNAGHVLFYDRRKFDGSGFETLESTTSGTMQGATRYSRTWTHLRGYYTRSWWDKQLGDDFNNPLTTKTGKSFIAGQQIYYRFSAGGTSTTVTVTANSGDPDLYVYDANYNFIKKSDNSGSDSVTFATTPGSTYYAKVHGWVDGNYGINW
jgi:hypothetical protein